MNCFDCKILVKKIFNRTRKDILNVIQNIGFEIYKKAIKK